MLPEIRRFCALLFLLLSLNTFLHSAPLKFVPVQITQPGGKIINCYASGDEYFNWLHDKDGYTIIRNSATGYYTYAIKENGRLTASNYIAGVDDDKRYLLEKYAIDDFDLSAQKKTRLWKIQSEEASGRPVGINSSTTGELSNIVIFIRFRDEPEFDTGISYYDGLFNSGNDISMHNYLAKISDGKLSVKSRFFSFNSQQKIISYRDAHCRAYYQPYDQIANDSGYSDEVYGTDSYMRELALLTNAIKSIQDKVPANLNVDGDNNGLVDNVCFIVSGMPTAWSTLLWPHMSEFSNTEDSPEINGKKVFQYNLQLDGFLKLSGPGVLAHEMLHSIGFPDLYHYDDDGVDPVGPWDVMANTGNVPQHPGIYMKAHYGNWRDNISEIKADGRYYLKPVSSPGGQGYIIRSPNSYREYFVVEYRKKTDVFESSLPGEGLLVYRICPFKYGNSLSGGKKHVPDEVYIFRPTNGMVRNGEIWNAGLCAEGKYSAIGDDMDPACHLCDGAKSGISIMNVGTCGDSIGFDLRITPWVSKLPAVLSPLPPEKVSKAGENDVWQSGTIKEVRWSGFTGSSLRIEYTTDAGRKWKTIARKVPSVNMKYNWKVPDELSDSCRIRISNFSSPDTFALSSVFSIAEWDRNARLTGNKLNSVSLSDSGSIFIGGYNGLLLYSPDKGKSWQHLPLPASQQIIEVCERKNSIYALASGADNVLLKSSDNGHSWQKIMLPGKFNITKAVVTDDAVIYCAGEPGSLLKSTDYGNTWTQLPFPVNFILQDIHFINGIIGWAISNLIYKTEDGGKSWNQLPDIPLEFFRSNMMCCYFSDENKGWVAGEEAFSPNAKGIILMTTNGGKSWKSTLFPEGSIRKITFADSKNGWAVGDTGFIAHTTDGGESWRRMNSGISSLRLLDVSAVGGNVFAVGEGGLILSTEYKGLQISQTADYRSGATEYCLSQNFPNPFNPETQIRFTLKNESRVTLKVFDLLGAEVRTLLSGYLPAGEHRVNFNGTSLPSGFYFYQIRAGEFTDTKKMLILK
ncbi:MAG: YCF48-related protein [Acidobacteriota bacterium]